jgi:hypothetical protein
MTAAELMGLLFLGRDVAHKIHLSTRSYSKHKALDEFYHAVVDAADAFAEAYQGKYGLMGNIPLSAPKRQGNIIEFLEAQAKEIEEGRDKVCDCSPVQNLIDEILAVYYTAIYKLKVLA